MKSSTMKKISGMLALVLIISILTPVIAFANLGFKNVTYKSGQVTGSVYSDVYSVTYGVYVGVYGSNGSFVNTPVTVTYNAYTGNYDFTASVTGYTYLNLLATLVDGTTVKDSVYSTVYDTTPTSSGGGAPSTSGDITVPADGSISATDLANAFKNSTSVTLKLVGNSVALPASGLADAVQSGASLTIVSDNGTYILPLSVLKLDDLAKALGVNVADLSIKVTISKVSGDTAAALNSAASSAGMKLLADAVDFNVEAVNKDGKSVKVDFGSTYVTRTLNVTGTVDASNTTGVLYDPVTKTFSFVPSTFETKDGKTIATLMRNGNSIYTVASFNKNFTDIANHWAKADIQLLANKLVIDGITDTTFAPDSKITRAQFAALVVRALGLSTSATSNTNFNDVKSSDWYAGVVAAAAKAGLVNGYEDGSFRADQQITREELSALIVRALKYAGVKADVSADQQASLLAKYTDSSKIVWAKAEIAAAIKAGIINGVTDTMVAPDKQASRAESATMLKRLLSKAGFIN